MYLVFDIGGTNMRVAVSHDGHTLDVIDRALTPPTAADGLAWLVTTAQRLAGTTPLTHVAGSIAGILDRPRGQLVFAPNLPGWLNYPLRQHLEQQFKLPLALENDAALAGLAEATLGAGKGSTIMAYVTVSTGVGGARIVRGKIDAATCGFEPGQHIIDLDSSACAACRTPGTLEHYVSGSGIQYRFKQAPAALPDRALWQEATHWLAVGLHNLTMFWSPDLIVLGGALILKQRIVLTELQAEFEKVSHVFPTLPTLKVAEQGPDNGLLGALIHLHSQNIENRLTS